MRALLLVAVLLVGCVAAETAEQQLARAVLVADVTRSLTGHLLLANDSTLPEATRALAQHDAERDADWLAHLTGARGVPAEVLARVQAQLLQRQAELLQRLTARSDVAQVDTSGVAAVDTTSDP